MAKLTLTDIVDFRNQTVTANTINSNNSAIEAALEKTLSRDGTTPNTMDVDFDMNSNDILNVGTISATLVDATDVQADTATIDDLTATTASIDTLTINSHLYLGPGTPGAIEGPQGPTGPTGPQGPAGSNGTNGVGVPTGGTTGQVLTKNSSTDYDTYWDTPSGGGVTDGDKGDIVISGTGTVYTIDSSVLSTFGRTLTDDADAATARTTLGLGTAATQATSAFEVPLTFSTGLTRTTDTITVNTSQNIATLSNLTSNGFVKTSGGTGTLSIDTNTYLTVSAATAGYQPLDAELTALAGLTSAADTLPYFNGAGTATTTTLTSFGRSLIDDADAATARTTLGLGTAATSASSAFEVPLTFSTGLTRTTNTITVNTSQNIATLSNLTSNGFVTTSGGTGALSIDTNTYLTTTSAASTYQPLDSDLTTIAGLTATTDSFLQSKASAWTTRTPTQVTADLVTFTGDTGSGGVKGLVPAPAAGDATKFLRGDGTWVTASGTGSVTDVSVVSANGFAGTVATSTSTPAITLTTSVTGLLYGDGTSISAATIGNGLSLSSSTITKDHALIYLASDYLTSGTTSQQKMFNLGTSSGGAITLETGSYRFQTLFYMNGMSATSGNATYSFRGAGTAVVSKPITYAMGLDSTTVAGTAGTITGTFTVSSNSNATLTGTTGTAMAVLVNGMFDVTTSGTIIPSFSSASSTAGTVKAGSYFYVERIAPTATTTIGTVT